MSRFPVMFIIITLALLSSGCANAPVGNGGNSSVCFSAGCFSVEVADTPEQWERGLMDRESLAQGIGMLFDFGKEGEYAFWMKDTLIPLDMIWIASDGTVVFIAEDVQPCEAVPCPSVWPGRNASYVLEVNAGMVSRLGIRVGDSAAIDLA